MLLVVPAAIVTIGVIIAPLFYAGWLSLHRTPLVGGSVFAGLTSTTRSSTAAPSGPASG